MMLLGGIKRNFLGGRVLWKLEIPSICSTIASSSRETLSINNLLRSNLSDFVRELFLRTVFSLFMKNEKRVLRQCRHGVAKGSDSPFARGAPFVTQDSLFQYSAL